MVICLEWDADLHKAQLMPLPLTVSCFTKIQIGFTFLVPAHPGSPGQRAVKRVCVCMLSVWHLLLLFFLCIVVCCCVWSVSGMSVLPLYFTFYKNLYASTAHLICGWRHLQVVQSICLYLHVYVMCLHKHVQVKTFSNRIATDFLFPAFS